MPNSSSAFKVIKDHYSSHSLMAQLERELGWATGAYYRMAQITFESMLWKNEILPEGWTASALCWARYVTCLEMLEVAGEITGDDKMEYTLFLLGTASFDTQGFPRNWHFPENSFVADPIKLWNSR